jgi:formylglycine-generating enzyme required for sulfatase activity
MVSISEGFYMGRTEVTQREWKAILGSLPENCTGGRFFERDLIGDSKPVICVNWDDAHDFIKKLNARGDGTYRLPTEAEWEYACRAGTTTKFSFGDDASALDNYAWHYSNSNNETHEVATKLPNAWGLHDMHGNVSEWCEDWRGDYPEGSATDPTGPTTGSDRVVRGGNFYTIPTSTVSGNRGGAPHDHRGSHVGFRVLITLLPSNSDIK